MIGPLSAKKRDSANRGSSSHDRILQAAKALFAKKGYENTSTAAIARIAGTSESQLIKHFGSKEGLLEAIFDQGWQKINAGIHQAVQDANSPPEKLNVLSRFVGRALEADPELKMVILLEGRHIRKQGDVIALSQGFLEFVRFLDSVLQEMRDGGQLRADLHPEAVRSALLGMFEGLLRDQILARRVGFPANYSAKDIGELFTAVLASFLAPTVHPTIGQARS